MDTVVLTPAGLLEILSQIEELKDVELGLTETLDGKLQLQVGESFYELAPEADNDIEVDSELVSDMEDLNKEAYEQLEASGEVSLGMDEETVESGIIKELAKTLLVGGMVRFLGHEIKK